MEKKRIIIINVIRFLVIIIIFFSLQDELFLPKELHAKIEGKPIVTVQTSERLYMEIRQMVNDDATLYILYGEHGVIQAYDFDGNYLYTISMYNHRNGGFDMAVEGNTLYVFDKSNNLYAFCNGEFVQFWSNDSEAVKYVRDRVGYSMASDDFEVRISSVWDVSSDEARCIIKRPAWLVIYQYTNVSFVFVLLGFAVFFWIYEKYRARKKQESPTCSSKLSLPNCSKL